MARRNPHLARDAKTELETRFVDRYGMFELLVALAEIAAEKSQHVEEAWQDRALARQWLGAADVIEKCALRVRDKVG